MPALRPVIAAALLIALAAPLDAARRYWRVEPSFADSPAGDFTAGEDPVVRRIAVEALGEWNGSVVVADASNGLVLSMVNQKLALADGYIPCSTVKLLAGLAALNEGVVEADTKIWFDGSWFMTLTEGLAISNNVYFHHLGKKLGFETVRRYAQLFGFGEKAGWRIPGEQLGRFPAEEHQMGVGRMTSFGDGISVTPLQLAAFVSALANGGTLYYLQHPTTPAGRENFRPRVKRYLPVARWIPDLQKGMREAVRRGTGKNARTPGQQIWGKTGTCSQIENRKRTRMGWFASYNEVVERRLAVVVMLRGNSMVYGPRAAEIAGQIYHDLAEEGYFPSPENSPDLTLAACCSE